MMRCDVFVLGADRNSFPSWITRPPRSVQFVSNLFIKLSLDFCCCVNTIGIVTNTNTAAKILYTMRTINRFWRKVWGFEPTAPYRYGATVFKTAALIHLCQPSVILLLVPKINHFSTQYFHVQLSEQVRQEHQRFIRWIQYCI